MNRVSHLHDPKKTKKTNQQTHSKSPFQEIRKACQEGKGSMVIMLMMFPHRVARHQRR